MPASKINYAAKSRGDLWTATDANEVKQIVNEHADVIDGHTSSLQTINETLDQHAQSIQQNGQLVRQIAQDFVKSVWVTQEEYDALVESGEIEETTEYNIYEEQT